MENDDELFLYRKEAEARIMADPVAYSLFNPAQIRCIDSFKVDGVTIVLITMGNGSGKTFVLPGAMAAAVMFGTANPLFAHPIYESWPYPKSARIMAPADLLVDNGPIQKAMQACWPAGRWQQSRGSGKGYYSHGETDTGWDWDVMTYNQTALQTAGSTKGLILCSEPPPEGLFGEMIGRLRAGGILAIEMTPLNYAAYLQDLADEKVVKDPDTGATIGRIITVQGDIHDNCADCHEGGQLPHLAIQRTIASWPIEEREARKSGGWMQLAGRVYRKWGEENGNEIEALPAYHQEKFDAGEYNLLHVQDPHDRRPFAMVWFAVFPNNDMVAIAEWPDDAYPPFHKISDSPFSDIDEYREMILATEAGLEKSADRRLEDPNFGNTPKLNNKTVKELFADSCQKCAREKKNCPHRLFFEDPPNNIAEGHLLVRRAIGNKAEGIRPKLYALAPYTPNFCYGMRRYGYEEKKAGKADHEKPQLINKDYPDLPRYAYNAGADKYRGVFVPKFVKPRFKRRANA